MTQLKFNINQEVANYIQRIMFEMDNKIFIVDRMFTNHKDDEDASLLLENRLFVKYMHEYKELRFQYVELTNLINKQILDFLNKNNYKFKRIQWNINDFYSKRELIIDLD